MRFYKSRTSKNILNRQFFYSKENKDLNFNAKFLNLKVLHKIFDCLNLSIFFMIIIYSFIALYSQKEWTEIYSSMIKIRIINNDLNGYISKTEEYFLNEVDQQGKFKKATSNDLIYLKKPTKKISNNFSTKELIKGIYDGKYQRGY